MGLFVRPSGSNGALRAWLGDRALGHDGPLALLRSAVDRLRRERLVRPGLTVLERIVAAARSDGEQEIHRRAAPVLTVGLQNALDELLVVASGATAAPIKQLAQETRSVGRIGESIENLELLRALDAEQWDLEMIPANRRRMLAQYVRHATSQAIGRRDAAFRHPALLAFCAEAAARVTDEWDTWRARKLEATASARFQAFLLDGMKIPAETKTPAKRQPGVTPLAWMVVSSKQHPSCRLRHDSPPSATPHRSESCRRARSARRTEQLPTARHSFVFLL